MINSSHIIRWNTKHFFLGTIFLCTVLYGAYFFRSEASLFLWEKFSLFPMVAVALNDDNATLAYDVGNYYFGGGAYDLTKAEKMYDRALKIDPSIQWGHFQKGRINFINGFFNIAINEEKKELELYPENLRPYYMLGLIYGYRGYSGDLEKAAEGFRRFVEWAPSEWAGHNDLAWILNMQGNFSEAQKVVITAFDTIPVEVARNPWLWTALGIASLNTGAYNEARDAFINALSISKDMTATYFYGAYPGNDFNNAEASFRNFKSILHFNRALSHEALGEFKKAEASYKQYVALLSENQKPSKNDIEERINNLNKHAAES